MNTYKKQSNYEKDATIRRQRKKIEKLQQEINALKVVLSSTPSNQSACNQVTTLSFETEPYKSFWQGDRLFNRTA